jgi:ubiquitin-protein ligase
LRKLKQQARLMHQTSFTTEKNDFKKQIDGSEDMVASTILKTAAATSKIKVATPAAELPLPKLGERKISKEDGEKYYVRLLAPHRVKFISKSPAHKYRPLANSSTGGMKLLKRLQQEYVGLRNSLPVHPDASLVLRVEESSMSLARLCIMPANGAYARGAFIFDVFFPAQYPSVPMKCNLATTGKGTFRFNPNLYQCGKVCLSLLGTWSGQGAENWDPTYSTFLQLCVSMLAQIFIEQPYFNEPGYVSQMNTPLGKKKSDQYNAGVRNATIKFAMLDQLENPPVGFEYVTQMHFFLSKEAIIEQVEGWLTDGISQGSDLTELKTLVPKLTAALKALERPEPPAEEEDSSDSDDSDEDS